MPASRDWEKPIRKMERLLRLKTFPIAFKLLENKADLAGVPFLRRLGHRSTLCQLLNIVRSFDWTVGADESDLMAPMCTSIIGLTDIPELMKDGTFRSIVWSKTKKDGEKYENSIPRIPFSDAVTLPPAPAQTRGANQEKGSGEQRDRPPPLLPPASEKDGRRSP